ncbi:MAG: transcriptional regulator, LysR family [Proteobacteria bacterium]|nr:transcriptional regulator, LysR family [Pseudomonadota bacterium]
MNNSIDLRQFRYFLALSEELNFGRAALRLHLSQPPLSRQIRLLEDRLGVDLFVRGSSGVTLSEAGTAFLPEVRKTLAQAERAVAAARNVRSAVGGQFVVGYTTVFDRSAIPDVFDRLRQSFPNWRFVAKGKHSISLVREVKNATMDAAFIGLHTETRGLTQEVIHQAPLLVALSAKHPLAKKRRLGFDDLRAEPMFWFERRLNPGFYDHCQAYFEQIDFKPKILPEPPEHHLLLGLIAEGQGVALISSSLREVKRQGVVFRALKEESNALTMGIAVAYAPNNRSAVLSAFLELVRSPPAGT